MENTELIRQLQQDRRKLEASIQKQLEALRGLEAYLKYLGATDKGREQEPSFPGLQVPSTVRTATPPRAYGGGKPSSTDGHSEKWVLAREVQKAVLEIEAEEFKQRDITDRIIEQYPDRNVHSASVYNALSRMAARGEVEKRDSVGSDSVIFRKVLHGNSLRETSDNEDGTMSD